MIRRRFVLSPIGVTMDKDDWDYYTYSVGEQLMVILWTSVGTLAVVGFILGIALR